MSLAAILLSLVATAAAIDSVVVVEPGRPRLRPRLDSLVGTPLDSAAVRLALEEAVDRSAAEGFLTARASADSIGPSGELHLSADAGGRWAWVGLVDAGGTRLDRTTLWRLSGLVSGERADPSRMEDARRRLLSTGYVEELSPPRPVAVPRTAGVLVRTELRDLPSSTLEGAWAWTQSQASSGYLEAHLQDILGTARDLDFGISEGEIGTDAHVRWKEPWLGPLDLQGILAMRLTQDTLSRVLVFDADLGWTSRRGSLVLTVGATSGSRAERMPGDSLFGPELSEWGTRLGMRFGSEPATAWPVRGIELVGQGEAVRQSSDTGSNQRLRFSGGAEGFAGVGPLVGHAGVHGRGIWPLDASVGLSEAESPGGIRQWRGWQEGSPRTPAWIYGTLEARLGSPRSGGVLAFFEPGAWAARRPDLYWRDAWSWSAGAGAKLILPAWAIDLVVSFRDDTPDWQESLLQARAVNRF